MNIIIWDRFNTAFLSTNNRLEKTASKAKINYSNYNERNKFFLGYCDLNIRNICKKREKYT